MCEFNKKNGGKKIDFKDINLLNKLKADPSISHLAVVSLLQEKGIITKDELREATEEVIKELEQIQKEFRTINDMNKRVH